MRRFKVQEKSSKITLYEGPVHFGQVRGKRVSLDIRHGVTILDDLQLKSMYLALLSASTT